MKKVINKILSHYGEILIFGSFVIIALVFTYPLILKIKMSLYGYPKHHGDLFAAIWGFWWFKYAWINDLPSRLVPIIASPFGVDYSQFPRVVSIANLAINCFSLIFDEIIAYNLVLLCSFAFSAIAMYFLVYYFTKDKIASAVAGMIFSFCPNHLMQGAIHLSLAYTMWIPLYTLFLFALVKNRTYKNAISCGLLFSLIIFSDFYLAYFMFIFTAMFICFRIIHSCFVKGRVKFNLKMTKMAGIAILVCLVIILPFFYPILRNVVGGLVFKTPISEPGDYVRAYKDLFKYAARWQDYFLPSEFHPLFGKLSADYVKSNWGARHYFERTLYLGFVPILLSVFAIGKRVVGKVENLRLKVKNKIFEKNEGYIISFFLFSAIAGFLFSLSPEITIGKFKIPMPSFFMYKIAPMFRVYARFGVIVMLSVSVLAGIGLSYLLKNIKKQATKVIVATSVGCLVLFEFINIPPFHNIDLSETPAVYEWLTSEPSDVVIAEYPWLRSIDEKHYEYLFYQRVHRKGMVNGAPDWALGDAIRKEARKIENPQTPSMLSYLGAKYVIVHKDAYDPEDIERISSNPGLAFVKDFPSAVVYQVVAEKPDLVKVFWKSFAMWERWGDGSVWRWAGNNATVWLSNATEENVQIDFDFNVLPFHRERTLEIFLNDELIKSMNVAIVPEPSLSQRVPLKMELMPGENIVRFFCPEGETKIDDILHNGDQRRVSFAFSDFAIIAQSPLLKGQ